MRVRSARRPRTSTKRRTPGSWRPSARVPRRPTTTRPRPRRSKRHARPTERPASRSPRPRSSGRSSPRGTCSATVSRPARSAFAVRSRRSRRRPDSTDHRSTPTPTASGPGSSPPWRRRTCSTAASTRRSRTGRKPDDWPKPSVTAPPSTMPTRPWGRASSLPAGWTTAGRCSSVRSPARGWTTWTRRRPAPTGCWARARPCSSSTTAPRNGCAKASRRPSGTNSGTTATTWPRTWPMSPGRPVAGREADDIARRSLADGRGGITTRTTALHAIGYVALGRGEFDAATEALEEARHLGSRMNELQRLSPALWGLAEVALARGDAGGGRRTGRGGSGGLGQGRRRRLPLSRSWSRARARTWPWAIRPRHGAGRRRWPPRSAPAASRARCRRSTTPPACWRSPTARPARPARRWPPRRPAGRSASAPGKAPGRSWTSPGPISAPTSAATPRDSPPRPGIRPLAWVPAAIVESAEEVLRQARPWLDPGAVGAADGPGVRDRPLRRGRTHQRRDRCGTRDHAQDGSLARGAHPGQARGRPASGDRGLDRVSARATLPAFTAMTAEE